MLGLPTETDEDVLAIADLVNKVLDTWRTYAKNRSRGVKINVSTSCFVPKPHTPFQWESQIDMAEYSRRVKLLRENMRSRSVSYSWHEPDVSFVEAVLSRGDRRVGRAIEEAWRLGGKLDSWSEYFSFDRWVSAFEKCGLDMSFYACRVRNIDEVLPWNIISVGVDKSYLESERKNAYAGKITPDCRALCTGCGANSLLLRRDCDE